jgi:hypothetical protein
MLTGAVVGVVAEAQMLHTDCHSELAEKKGWVVLELQNPYKDPFIPWLLHTIQMFTVIAKKAWRERFTSDIIEKKIKRGDVWRIAMNGRSVNDFTVSDSPPTSQVSVDEWAVAQRHSTLEGWWRLLSQEKSELDENVESNTAKSIYRNIVGHFSTYPHRKGCLFTTTNGYVASASKEVQNGDEVCILFGCAMPLVLRPRNDGTYAIIDAAYVEGIMEGEFLQDKAQYTDTKFVIS